MDAAYASVVAELVVLAVPELVVKLFSVLNNPVLNKLESVDIAEFDG